MVIPARQENGANKPDHKSAQNSKNVDY